MCKGYKGERNRGKRKVKEMRGKERNEGEGREGRDTRGDIGNEDMVREECGQGKEDKLRRGGGSVEWEKKYEKKEVEIDEQDGGER